jgi:hypothetical protein
MTEKLQRSTMKAVLKMSGPPTVGSSAAALDAAVRVRYRTPCLKSIISRLCLSAKSHLRGDLSPSWMQTFSLPSHSVSGTPVRMAMLPDVLEGEARKSAAVSTCITQFCVYAVSLSRPSMMWITSTATSWTIAQRICAWCGTGLMATTVLCTTIMPVAIAVFAATSAMADGWRNSPCGESITTWGGIRPLRRHLPPMKRRVARWDSRRNRGIRRPRS